MRSTSASKRWFRLGLAAVLLAAAGGFIACSDNDGTKPDATTGVATKAATQDSSSEVRTLRQVFLDAVDRWNANDLDGFVALFTEAGIISSFGDDEDSSFGEAKASLANDRGFGSAELGRPEFSDVSVSGDIGSMDAEFSYGVVLLHSKFGLVKDGPDWKINHEESTLPDVPAGAATIGVDLSEFAFGTDVDAIADVTGVFALEAKNIGSQTHMISLARIPADANIEELLQSDDPVGVVDIASVGDIAPGMSKSLVFVRPLDPGRYVMVCFLPDTDEGEDGTPHVFKGQLKEFTIE